MIKLFASDLDGTLLNGLHEADRTIRSAIKKAIDLGRTWCPRRAARCCRSATTVLRVSRSTRCVRTARSCAGKTAKVLKTFGVDPAFVEELVREFPQICFDCCTPDGMFSSGSYEMHQEGFKRDGLMRRIIMRGMRARGGAHEEQFFDQSLSSILSHEVCKINCRVTTAELDRELKAFLADHTGTVVNAPFDPVMFEITDKDCNKGESVAWLGRYYGIDEDEIAVYGDGGE